jgi:hypothetical protein
VGEQLRVAELVHGPVGAESCSSSSRKAAVATPS